MLLLYTLQPVGFKLKKKKKLKIDCSSEKFPGFKNLVLQVVDVSGQKSRKVLKH